MSETRSEREQASDWRLSAEQERDVLNFEPWGDLDATYRLIRQGFCAVRVPHECAICFGPISRGDRVWFRTEQDDGKMATFRFCPECCYRIAHGHDDHDGLGPDPWALMDERWEVGRRRAEAREVGSHD
jgi:hypothetical protein